MAYLPASNQAPRTFRRIGIRLSPNIWLGVSMESQDYVFRIEYLKRSLARIKFLSCEPLLGSLDLSLEGIDWVIAGGESGHKHRPVEEEWVVRGV